MSTERSLWSLRSLSSRVNGRAHGTAQSRTQVSWVPGGILSRACSSQPRLGPGRPSLPHALSGFADRGPEVRRRRVRV